MRLAKGKPAARATWLRVLWRLAPATGAILGLHFAGVATAVQTTSLTHAILACNTAPLWLILLSLSRFALARALSVVVGGGAGGFGALDAAKAPTPDEAAAAASAAVAAAAWWSSDELDVVGESASRDAMPLALPCQRPRRRVLCRP